MDTAKVKELMGELEAEIRIRQEALRGLGKLLSSHGEQRTAEQMQLQDSARPILFTATDSYVDLAVKVISANDYKPMKMKDIVDRIRIIKSNPNIERRSVEATLTRHVATKGELSRIVRTGRGTWGTRRFPREASIA